MSEFMAVPVKYGFRHADGSLIYPGWWVETYVRMPGTGCWLLVAFKQEAAR